MEGGPHRDAVPHVAGDLHAALPVRPVGPSVHLHDEIFRSVGVVRVDEDPGRVVLNGNHLQKVHGALGEEIGVQPQHQAVLRQIVAGTHAKERRLRQGRSRGHHGHVVRDAEVRGLRPPRQFFSPGPGVLAPGRQVDGKNETPSIRPPNGHGQEIFSAFLHPDRSLGRGALEKFLPLAPEPLQFLNVPLGGRLHAAVLQEVPIIRSGPRQQTRQGGQHNDRLPLPGIQTGDPFRRLRQPQLRQPPRQVFLEPHHPRLGWEKEMEG